MLYRKQKVFRYRYDFDPKLLEEFIRERYFNNESAGKLEEILSTRVSLNGEAVDDKTVVQKGDWIEYIHLRSDEDSLNFEPEILYEDDWLIAISKPDFLPVIPNTSFILIPWLFWSKKSSVEKRSTRFIAWTLKPAASCCLVKIGMPAVKFNGCSESGKWKSGIRPSLSRNLRSIP